MLVNQIQPHFIFNTLTSIQNLYDEKNENASLAMNEFAKHLRWQIDSINNELVTFEEELDNIFNFINLYSLSKNFNVDVLYDIDYIDFSIPSFSLQPFIENCLKHAGLNEKVCYKLACISTFSSKSAYGGTTKLLVFMNMETRRCHG